MKKQADNTGDKTRRKGPGTMDVILIIVGVSLFAFTVCMINLFKKYGAVPDTLVTCVFAALAGECGIMGWIKTSKEKRQSRDWQIEDEMRAREEKSSGPENM